MTDYIVPLLLLGISLTALARGENGYEIMSYGNHCHDTYRKDGIIFEIHRKLAEDSDKTKKAYHYYKNVLLLQSYLLHI